MSLVAPVGASWRTALAVAIALLSLSFLVRLEGFSTAFKNGGAQFPPVDDLYHARRMVYSALHFPRVLQFDPERGPGGAWCPWPPLYDLAAGGVARLLGGQTTRAVLVRVTWIPPITASFFVAALAARSARRFGLLAGLVAATGTSFALPFLESSRIGSIDHHFLEGPLLFGILFSLWRLLQASDLRSGLRGGLLLGASLSAALFVQTALLLAAGLALLALLLFSEHPSTLRGGCVGFALASGALLAYRLTLPAGYPNSEWFLGFPHIAALLAAAVACGLTLYARARGLSTPVSALWGVAGGVLAAAAVPGSLAAFDNGTRFMGGDPWLKTITEFRPLFLDSWTRPGADLLLLGGGGLLALPASAWALRKGPSHRMLALFTVAYLVASLSSRRFLTTGMPLFCLTAAVLVGDLIARGRLLMAVSAAFVVMGPALAGLTLDLTRPSPVVPPSAAPMIRAARLIQQQADPGGRVLGPWSWGHLLHIAGGHPVVIDNFGAMPGRTTFENAVTTMLLTKEESLAAFCRATGVRFLVIDNPYLFGRSAVEILELNRQAFYSDRQPGPPRPTRLLERSFWWRAYFEPGPFRLFRLIYSDPAGAGAPAPWDGPAVKVLEFLPPAV